MIFKQSSSARAQSRKSPSRPSLFLQKRTQQNVLIKRNKKESAKIEKSTSSYFIRVFISGILVSSLFFLGIFLKVKFFHLLDLDNSYTLAIAVPRKHSKSLTVVSLRGSEKGIQVMEIPINELISKEDDSQRMNIFSNIKKVLEEGPSQYGHMQSLIATQLGFPIDAVIEFEDENELQGKSDLLNIFNPANVKKTNGGLSMVNRIQLWKYIFLTDASHIEHHTFFAKSNPQTDNEESLISQSELLNVVQKYYSDTAVRKLTPTIAVVNNTSQNGLAKRLGDIFNSWGFSVIQLNSEQGNYQGETELILETELISSPAFYRLQLLLPEKMSYKSDQVILQKYRSQMVLFVGEDFLQLIGEGKDTDQDESL